MKVSESKKIVSEGEWEFMANYSKIFSNYIMVHDTHKGKVSSTVVVSTSYV